MEEQIGPNRETARLTGKKPRNLYHGRASDETVVLHMSKYRSRTLRVIANRLSNVQGQT